VKKNTGELEPILPQWLRDVRQQARESAEADAAAEAARPKARNEPPDLLAGLASQGRDEEEEIPDWLASINPAIKPKPGEAKPERSPSDFFSQFNKAESAREQPPAEEETPSWTAAEAEAQPIEEEKDELSEWFTQAAEEPEQTVEIDHDIPPWMGGSDEPSYRVKEPEPPVDEEDLDWLHNLEASAGKPTEPKIDSIPGSGFTSAPSAEGGEDLSWLNELGGGQPLMPAETAQTPQGIAPEPRKSETSQEPQADLSWLDQFGDISSAVGQESAPAEATSRESPDWLNFLGEQSSVAEEKPSREDLSRLQAESDKGMGEPSPGRVSPFVPRGTGPLESESTEEAMPDWLKSATEESSMPAPGVLSEWFRESSTGGDEKPSTFAKEGVDSLLSKDTPGWLSSPEDRPKEQAIAPSTSEGSLAPVDLPAWVQAMRPVESVLPEAPGVESQPAEREGPLAGLRGVIPAAPIGSALRPKPLSLKLQASDEQMAGAVLLEQILAGESNPRPLASRDVIASQRVLRWIVAGLFIFVLGAMMFLGTRAMPISADLPDRVEFVSNAIATIPQSSNVLVVLDYEPALAGELEAVAGPMLDQMALLRRPRLSFLSTSPNGSVLVSRLLRNTNLSRPLPGGLDYKPGVDYFNLGYLPGGASGVLEFVGSPNAAIPAAGVNVFSEYSAVILLTDHSESARAWVEQLHARKQIDLTFSTQPLLVAASAQAGPLLEPYVSSRQITGMVNGLPEAARYEYVNTSRPGNARRYWDSFGAGTMMAIVFIALGSLWSVVSGMRARRAEAELG
jgi:hypothetical protein